MSSVCIQLVVVAVTLLLSDVTCQTVHNINISDEVHSGRQRREALPMTQKQISQIVDRHNVLRSREGAANMQLMAWSTSLATKAANWAARCIKEHEGPRPYGQNMYVRDNKLTDMTVPVRKWHDEKPLYSKGLSCIRPGVKCLHYTQVVWASSRYVGCAAHYCDDSWTLVVCNYSPGGNIKHTPYPYTKGPACSKCGNGAGWCKNKLCNWQCTRAGEGCKCAAICYNCAELDLETCQCKCAKGWRGVDCTVRCKNRHEMCGRSPGYPKSWCNHPTYKDTVKRRCPAMCGMCEEDPNAKADLCAPDRGPDAGEPAGGEPTADSSAQTMFIKSHQSTMIFVMMIIISFTINSSDAL